MQYFFSVKYLYRRLYFTRSNIFENNGTTEVGQRQVILQRPSLGPGTPRSDELNKYLKRQQSLPKQRLIISKFILSAPGLFLFSKKRRHLSIRLLTNLHGFLIFFFYLFFFFCIHESNMQLRLILILFLHARIWELFSIANVIFLFSKNTGTDGW